MNIQSSEMLMKLYQKITIWVRKVGMAEYLGLMLFTSRLYLMPKIWACLLNVINLMMFLSLKVVAVLGDAYDCHRDLGWGWKTAPYHPNM